MKNPKIHLRVIIAALAGILLFSQGCDNTPPEKKLFQCIEKGQTADFIKLYKKHPRLSAIQAAGLPGVFHKQPIPLIHYAALAGQTDILDFLLSGKTPIDSEDTFGFTPLMYAAMKKRTQTINLLLKKGSAVNRAASPSGATALLIASRYADTQTVKLLLDNNADPNLGRRLEKNRDTPIAIAVSADNLDIVKLLHRHGAGLTPELTGKRSLLSMAVFNKNVEMVKFLGENGVEIDEPDDGRGKTPLILAADLDLTQTIAYLIEKGADVHAIASANGFSAVRYAVKNNSIENVTQLIEAGSTKKELSESLISAVYYNHANMFEYLIQNGADIQIRGNNKETLLHWTANKNAIEICRYLLDNGVPVNVRETFEGQTALMKAAAANRLEIAQLLLDHGADRARVDTSGHTALDYATTDEMKNILLHYRIN